MADYVYSVQDIKEILPHRYPFLLVDRVLEFTQGPDPSSRVGRKIKAIKNISVNEPFFIGHFPTYPIFPGVLMIEAMAQAGALACYTKGDLQANVAIASVNSARFRKPVHPGDQVILEVEVVKDRRNIFLLDCKAYVDKQLAAEAQILAHVDESKKN